MSGLFYLGLVLLVGSGVFGAVTHYYSVETALKPREHVILIETPLLEDRPNIATYTYT